MLDVWVDTAEGGAMSDRETITEALDRLPPEEQDAYKWGLLLQHRDDWKAEALMWKVVAAGLGLFAALGWTFAGLGVWS